jgi:hypothetical protein
MDEAWIVSFLTRHRFGPPADPNAPEGACMFDRAASTVTDVVKALDADAQQNGVGLNADRTDIVNDVLQQRQRGAAMGASLAKHMEAGDDSVSLFLEGLRKQKMVAMLEALQAVRGAKKLDELLDLTRNDLHDPRLEVAILSVQQHLGGEWQLLYDKLTDDADKTAIRTHVFGKIEDGDAGDKQPIKHGNQGYQNDSADDAAWIAGFLKFVNASPDPSGNGSGDTCQFNGIPMPFQRAVDSVVEQAALAGRMIDQSAVSGPLAKLVVAPPRKQAGGANAPQYSIAYALQPGVPQAGGSPAPAQSQIAFTGTMALHADGASGPEVAWTVQIAHSVKGYVLQNIQTGPQAQWVWPCPAIAGAGVGAGGRGEHRQRRDWSRAVSTDRAAERGGTGHLRDPRHRQACSDRIPVGRTTDRNRRPGDDRRPGPARVRAGAVVMDPPAARR